MRSWWPLPEGLRLDRTAIKEVAIGGLLHDVGKARVPDEILNKPAKLSDAEFEQMKSHVTQSVAVLEHTPGVSQTALAVAAQHHERFDGSGYPHKLAGEGITLHGQMAAIVDVYDAISSDRGVPQGNGADPGPQETPGVEQPPFRPATGPGFHPGHRHLSHRHPGSPGQRAPRRGGRAERGKPPGARRPVFYNANKQYYIPPEMVDLAKSQDRIAAFETYEKWKIDPYQWLPA